MVAVAAGEAVVVDTLIGQSAKCPEFAAEALRVLRSSPKWIPGKANGQYVRSYRELPIRMSVNELFKLMHL